MLNNLKHLILILKFSKFVYKYYKMQGLYNTQLKLQNYSKIPQHLNHAQGGTNQLFWSQLVLCWNTNSCWTVKLIIKNGLNIWCIFNLLFLVSFKTLCLTYGSLEWVFLQTFQCIFMEKLKCICHFIKQHINYITIE
jgi:hypothetical protein